MENAIANGETIGDGKGARLLAESLRQMVDLVSWAVTGDTPYTSFLRRLRYL